MMLTYISQNKTKKNTAKIPLLLCTRKWPGSQKKFCVFIWISATAAEIDCGLQWPWETQWAASSPPEVTCAWKTVMRMTLGSKDCHNLAKERWLIDCFWANSPNSLREEKWVFPQRCSSPPRCRTGLRPPKMLLFPTDQKRDPGWPVQMGEALHGEHPKLGETNHAQSRRSVPPTGVIHIVNRESKSS